MYTYNEQATSIIKFALLSIDKNGNNRYDKVDGACTCGRNNKKCYTHETVNSKFINVCEGFIWRNSGPSLNRKDKYLQR